MEIAVDVLTLISVAALAIPAYHINRYAFLASRMASATVDYPTTVRQRRRDLARKFVLLRDEWKPWKAMSLHIGTAAAVTAAIVSLISKALAPAACALH